MNESKEHLNPKITPEILSMINSDNPGCDKEFNPSLCRVRHMAAKLREERGRRYKYDPCCYCPKFVSQKIDTPEPEPIQEEPETMPTAPKINCITPDCPNTVKAHGKTGRCHSCQAKVNAKLAHEARKNKKPAPRTDEKKTWNGQANQPGYAIVGTYPEPAADTIHASQPPEKLVIHIEESDVCRRAINQYGILRQMAKAAEEFAEAAAAINRHMATEGSHEEIISELADVEVMCVQMRMILGANAIEQQRAEKVARLNGRLKP